MPDLFFKTLEFCRRQMGNEEHLGRGISGTSTSLGSLEVGPSDNHRQGDTQMAKGQITKGLP